MIVPCQKCQTKFKLDDSKIPPEGAWVRCSKCGEVFQVEPPGTPEPPAPPEAPSAEGLPPEDDLGLDLGLEDESGPEDSAALADFGLEEETAPAKAGKGPGGFFKAVFWILGILILLAVLALGGLVALDRLGSMPHLVDPFRNLPGLKLLLSAKGPVEAAHDKTLMGPVNVRGYYRLNDKVGRIFVIQGLVENRHPGRRTHVLVRGRLLDKRGQVARQAVVYAGPMFTPEELKTLSLEEMQRRLADPKGPDGSLYVVEPGSTIPFMIVFAHLPDNLAEFMAEVVGSRPYRTMPKRPAP